MTLKNKNKLYDKKFWELYILVVFYTERHTLKFKLKIVPNMYSFFFVEPRHLK